MPEAGVALFKAAEVADIDEVAARVTEDVSTCCVVEPTGGGRSCQSHADNFKRVGEADGDGAGQAATEESAYGRLFVFGRDHDGADLLIGEELDTSLATNRRVKMTYGASGYATGQTAAQDIVPALLVDI
ncbi:hypothetical protein KCU87_g199, partial [Aureobasidium melanogenum]